MEEFQQFMQSHIFDNLNRFTSEWGASTLYFGMRSTLISAIEFCDKHENLITAFSTVALAVFTSALWVSTNRLWKATNSQLELGQQEFVANNHPRIIVRKIKDVSDSGAGYEWTSVTLVNIGGTKGTITHCGGEIAYKGGNKFYEPGIDDDPKPISPIVLRSGDRHEFKAISRITKELIKDKYGAAPIWCVGFVKYVDDIGIVRETRFERLHDNRFGKFVPIDDSEKEYVD